MSQIIQFCPDINVIIIHISMAMSTACKNSSLEILLPFILSGGEILITTTHFFLRCMLQLILGILSLYVYIHQYCLFLKWELLQKNVSECLFRSKFMRVVCFSKKIIYLKSTISWLSGSFTSCIVHRPAPQKVRHWHMECVLVILTGSRCGHDQKFLGEFFVCLFNLLNVDPTAIPQETGCISMHTHLNSYFVEGNFIIKKNKYILHDYIFFTWYVIYDCLSCNAALCFISRVFCSFCTEKYEVCCEIPLIPPRQFVPSI